MKYKLVYRQPGNNYSSGITIKEMTFQEMKDKIITYACMDDDERKPDLRSVKSVAKALEPGLYLERVIKIYD